MFPLRRQFGRSAWRRCCAAVTLVAYLATAFGVPLPAAAPRRDGQPFPCQDHPCGCQTAEECWTGCCCFTPEERWAWAEARGIQPPPYAERPAASCTKPCCAEHGDDGPPCCQTGHGEAAPAKGGVRWRLGVSALGCKGHSTLWVHSGAALPVVVPPTPRVGLPPAGWLEDAQGRPIVLPFFPPEPPPRTSCA